MATTEQDVYTLVLDADVLPASRKVAAYQKDLDREFKKVTKSIERMASTTDKANKKSARGVGDLVDAYKEESQTVSSLTRILDGLNRRAAKASGQELKVLQKRIKDTKTLFATQKAAAKNGIKESAKAAKAEQRQAKATSKKMKGLFDTLFEGTGVGKKSKEMREKSATMSKRGGAVAKMGGKMGGMKGGALKGVGKAMGGIGKLVGVFSKIVPILGMVGTAVMAVVKLFLDADAHVKEFNKSILDLAGSNEFLGSTTKGTTGDFQKMKSVLTDIRKTAEEFWFNNDWGIMPEDHVKVLNVMNQEGVSLRAMGKEAEVAYGSVKKYQQELMAVSVAYSRAFGIPMQEINTLQAELMTEMGMGLEDTKLAFAQMSRAASDSGIASNKFFAMIRGVSSDLSLYNLRLGSAVKLLGMLGKVMNPREAQKFMQFATQGLKGMSQDDRLKLNLLTGGKGKKILAKDLEIKRGNLGRDIASALGKTEEADIEAIRKDVKSGNAQKWLDQIKDPGKKGTLQGSAFELEIDTTASGKGAYGEAFAMENMGIGGSLKMMKEAFAGGGSLSGRAGELGMTKMAEGMGVGTQQLRGFMKLEKAVEMQRKSLLAQAEKDLSGAELTRRQSEINSMDEQDILDKMSKEEQAILKEGTKSEMDLMKEQTKLQDSITNQIARLLDFLMNQLYTVLSSVLDMFIALGKKLDFFGGGGPSDVEKVRDQEQLFKKMEEGDLKKALQAAWQETAGMESGDRLREYEKKSKPLISAEVEKDRTNQLKSTIVGGEVGPLGPEQQATLDRLAKVLDPDALRKALQTAGGDKAVAALGDKPLTPENIREALVEGGVDKMAADKESRGVYAEAMAMDPEALASMKAWNERGQQEESELVAGPDLGTYHGGVQGGPDQETVDSDAALMKKVAQKKAGTYGDEAVNDYMAHLQAPEGTPYGTPVTAEGETDYAALFAGGSEPQMSMAKVLPDVAASTEAAAEEGAKTHKLLSTGSTAYVQFSKSFLKGDYKTVIAEAMLDSMRLALFEYFLYKDTDPEDVVKVLQDAGLSGSEFAKALGEGAPTGQGVEMFGLSSSDDDDEDDPPANETPEQKKAREAAAKKKKEKKKKRRQHGGMVKRIDQYGYAEFEPRSGEGLTAIGPGESISPAYNRGKGGGGGQHVTVSLKGDAMRLFEVMVTDGIYKNKQRERNH